MVIVLDSRQSLVSGMGILKHAMYTLRIALNGISNAMTSWFKETRDVIHDQETTMDNALSIMGTCR